VALKRLKNQKLTNTMKITFSWMMMIIPEAEINYVTTGTTRQNHKKNFFLVINKIFICIEIFNINKKIFF